MLELAKRLHQMDAAHDIGVKCLDRDVIGEANKGLCGEMKNHVGLYRKNTVLYRGAIPNVSNGVIHTFDEAQLREEIRLGIGRK
jgi:hypothetical protein